MNEAFATRIIESLRNGIPPRVGVTAYSVGHEKLLEGIRKRHLSGIEDRGLIRFISGSWGAGKTHFFRLLRELAHGEGCLVSTVDLTSNDSATLNKFESIFFSIIKNIGTPAQQSEGRPDEATPLRDVLKEAAYYLGTGERDSDTPLSHDQFARAAEKLMEASNIDIDFKKIVQAYWKTLLLDAGDPIIVERTRADLIQWFSGVGSPGQYRLWAEVHKMVRRDNAKLMLQSLAGFVRLAGYRGLVILFDEAEKAFTAMRKTQLRDAHNNLLSLINNIETLPGVFLVYATVPEFFTDPKHGIVIYGALAGRIGKPEDRNPRALDTIWNLDAVEPSIEQYQEAALKLRTIYQDAYPEVVDEMPDDDTLATFVVNLEAQHPMMAQVRFWRVLMKALVVWFDDILEGDDRSVEKLYIDVMNQLRES